MRFFLRIKHILFALFLAFQCFSSYASSLVTLNFSGTLTDSFGSLTAGDAFTGSYTFDTTIPGSADTTGNFAVFNNLVSVNLNIGSFSASIGPGAGLPEIQQDNVSGADRYALLARNAIGNSQIAGSNIDSFGFRLDDTTGNAISDALTLLTAPTLSSFTSNGLFIFFIDSVTSNLTVIGGTLSTLEVSPAAAPIPAAFWLMGSALFAGLTSINRRKI